MKYLVDKQKRVTKKRVMGIEPTYPAWKAGVLPLNYTRRCPVPESNQRHKDFQSFALPTELTGLVAHNKDYFKGRNLCCQAKNENYIFTVAAQYLSDTPGLGITATGIVRCIPVKDFRDGTDTAGIRQMFSHRL